MLYFGDIDDNFDNSDGTVGEVLYYGHGTADWTDNVKEGVALMEVC